MLPANVNLAGRSAGGTGNRLLQDLRRRVVRSTVILILLESLISSASVDGKRNRSGDGNTLKTYGDGVEGKINPDIRIAVAHRNRFGLWTETQEARSHRISSGRDIVRRVASECVCRSV